MCISYLDKQGFSNITEHVNWKNDMKELCLITVGFKFKIYAINFFNRSHVKTLKHVG